MDANMASVITTVVICAFLYAVLRLPLTREVVGAVERLAHRTLDFVQSGEGHVKIGASVDALDIKAQVNAELSSVEKDEDSTAIDQA